MGKLAFVALHLNRLEVAFLQDNLQAFRHEARTLLAEVEKLPGETLPLEEPSAFLGRLDLPESWL